MLASLIVVYQRLTHTRRPLRHQQTQRRRGFVAKAQTAVLNLDNAETAALMASSGAAFAALCPAMTALLAIPILGEWPAPIDWVAIRRRDSQAAFGPDEALDGAAE